MGSGKVFQCNGSMVKGVGMVDIGSDVRTRSGVNRIERGVIPNQPIAGRIANSRKMQGVVIFHRTR